MLLGTLGASLLGNLLTGKGVYRAGKGKGINRAGEGVLRAGYGNNNNNNNNTNNKKNMHREFRAFSQHV